MENMGITQDTACKKPKKQATSARVKCSKPGPVTNNGYLNYVRFFRKKNCGLKPRELISKAAQAWNCLPERTKNIYRRQACKVTTSCKHKERPVCNKSK